MIDPTDPRSAFAGLRDRDYARAGLMVCEGRIVIEKALEEGVTLRSLLCVPADEEEWRGLSAGTFPVAAMARAEMAELLGFSFHRGMLALADRPRPPDPASLPAGHALVLWNVTDPDNLGALIRSAAALGASRVCLGPGCADPYSRKALRASMACALGMPVVPLAGIGDLELARGFPVTSPPAAASVKAWATYSPRRPSFPGLSHRQPSPRQAGTCHWCSATKAGAFPTRWSPPATPLSSCRWRAMSTRSMWAPPVRSSCGNCFLPSFDFIDPCE